MNFSKQKVQENLSHIENSNIQFNNFLQKIKKDTSARYNYLEDSISQNFTSRSFSKQQINIKTNDFKLNKSNFDMSSELQNIKSKKMQKSYIPTPKQSQEGKLVKKSQIIQIHSGQILPSFLFDQRKKQLIDKLKNSNIKKRSSISIEKQKRISEKYVSSIIKNKQRYLNTSYGQLINKRNQQSPINNLRNDLAKYQRKPKRINNINNINKIYINERQFQMQQTQSMITREKRPNIKMRTKIRVQPQTFYSQYSYSYNPEQKQAIVIKKRLNAQQQEYYSSSKISKSNQKEHVKNLKQIINYKQSTRQPTFSAEDPLMFPVNRFKN